VDQDDYQRYYGFLPTELSDDIFTCRICGGIVRTNEHCNYCHDLTRFPLWEMIWKAYAAWLHLENGPSNELWLLSRPHRERIFDKYVQIPRSS
jgi:hypothetical protein